MKTQLLRTSVVALLAAMIGYGQSPRMYVDIPFSFVAGGETLPAGPYTVDTSTPGVIVVKSAEQKASAMVSTIPVQSVDIQPASKLVFRRYGGTYLLSQVWTLGTLTAAKRLSEAASANSRSRTRHRPKR
jgi:hypothetical protein